MQQRLKMKIAYNGTNFVGWARQAGLRSVQGQLEAALMQITGLPVIQLGLTVAGRTDSGVHAAGQVAHFDLPQEIWEKLATRRYSNLAQALLFRLNGVLARAHDNDIAVLSLEPVSENFDARFSALYRRYRYRICDQVGRVNCARSDILNFSKDIDVEQMHKAVQALIGEHDFLPFSKPRAGASTVRTVEFCSWKRIPVLETNKPEEKTEKIADAGLVVFDIQADAFTHSMVRSIVGASLLVGQCKRGFDWFYRLIEKPDTTWKKFKSQQEHFVAGLISADVLAASEREYLEMMHSYQRASGVQVAPAVGLTFEEVGYPDADCWQDQQVQTRTVRAPLY